MLRNTLAALLVLALLPAWPLPAAQPAKIEMAALPRPGRKIPLGTGHYFTYGFVKSPKVGTAVMRVEIFTLADARDHSFVVKGDADMPSMRGAHSTGDKTFAVSAKGIYLLPVHIAMPGDWEIKLTIEKDGKALFRGIHLFDV